MNQEKIEELSMLQKNTANISAQKQQFVSQLAEFESALESLDHTENAYKIIGNVMVSSSKKSLKEDINKKIEVIEVRIKSFEKQENRLKEKAEILQKEIMSGLDKEDKKEK